jgi:hypothetical protein
MLYNGEIDTTTAAIYTAPLPTPGIPFSGSPVEINFFRIVNESATARTFTIWVNANGTDRALTPIDTKLSEGAAYDDVPVFKIPPGAQIRAVADAAGVSWSINASI